MKTLFLEWQQVGTENNIWVAKDPLDIDVRWIVRKTNFDSKSLKYKVLWVKNSVENFVGMFATLNRSQWAAVSFSIGLVATTAFESTTAIAEERVLKSWNLLENMTKGDFHVG